MSGLGDEGAAPAWEAHSGMDCGQLCQLESLVVKAAGAHGGGESFWDPQW